jgi:hypothetical protein
VYPTLRDDSHDSQHRDDTTDKGADERHHLDALAGGTRDELRTEEDVAQQVRLREGLVVLDAWGA